MEINRPEFPQTVLQYYISMYCKKKELNSCDIDNIVKASKSWLSLSAEEKQKITDKFNESISKYRTKFADYLKKSEPYLKEKKNRREAQQNVEIINLDSSEDNDENEEPRNNRRSSHSPERIQMFVDENHFLTNDLESISPNQDFDQYPLIEPEPPSIRTALQLYQKINPSENAASNYRSLSESEKKRYQKAVLMLKKNFITKYMEYLECLPSEDLFHYYDNKTLV